MDADHVQAELDACAVTIRELRQENKELRALAALLNSHLMLALDALESKGAEAEAEAKRKVGRPEKRHDHLIDQVQLARDAYAQANPTKGKVGDNVVLTWYFGNEFEKLGMRASRASTPAFQAKLKTLRNRLSDATHPTVKKSR